MKGEWEIISPTNFYQKGATSTRSFIVLGKENHEVV